MKVCDRCQHVGRNDSKNPVAWLCALFPQHRLNALTGGELPPYRYCRDVLRLTCPNDSSPCNFFKALPETGEAVVKEARGGKSVTYRAVPDKPDRPFE